MDPTLLTILLLLVTATVLALIQARRRDRCLKSFDHFHITLAETDGDLRWGEAHVFTSGLEITYSAPVKAREGHEERSFMFYHDQYDALGALFRYPQGLSEEARLRREEVIRRTAQPSLLRRFGRKLRNWISMIRDALMQAVSLILGAAKARKPGIVMSGQEQHITALSKEIIGYAGNAYDPLLERHLFKQVVLEVTQGEQTYSYCGWLKNYTAQFIEIVDAFANTTGLKVPVQAVAVGEANPAQIEIRLDGRRLYLTNQGAYMLHVPKIEAGDWQRRMGVVLPPQSMATLMLPPNVDLARLQAWVGTVERVDLVVPRTHALVRHAAHRAEVTAHGEGEMGAFLEQQATQRTQATP